MPYKNNKFKDVRNNIDEESELSGAFSSISDTQKYFKYIIKKHKILTDKPSVEIYINRIQKGVIFRIKYGFYLELLVLETTKRLGDTEKKKSRSKMVRIYHVWKTLSSY